MVSELVSKRNWATEAGTRRFVQRHRHGKAASAYQVVAGQMHLSSLGIGTYLGAADDATDRRYEDAIVEAVRQGINVIDTASNYRRGRAEAVVGRALRQLMEIGEVYRSEVLLSSKVGFVPRPRDPSQDSPQWFIDQTVGAGLAEPDELVCGCHCMAPRYITHSLERSLQQLQVETLDVLFVHNPESQLQLLPRAEVLDRVRRAFGAMEQAVDAGKVRVYGVATWTALRARPEERDYLSLEELVRCAEDVAGSRHHFKAVQLPLSMRLPEALTWRQQPVGGALMSPLEAANALGLVAFTSATLHQGKLCDGATAGAETAPVADELTKATLDALQFGRSAPGVTSALVGMSQVAHVRSNVRVLRQERAPEQWLLSVAQRPTGAAVEG